MKYFKFRVDPEGGLFSESDKETVDSVLCGRSDSQCSFVSDRGQKEYGWLRCDVILMGSQGSETTATTVRGKAHNEPE